MPAAASPSSRRPTSARCRPSSPTSPSSSPSTDDDGGPRPEALAGRARRALPLRAAELPEPERPLDRRARRAELARAAEAAGVPIVEDNPYGDLWYDAAPPAPIACALARGHDLSRQLLEGARARPAPGLRRRAAGGVRQAGRRPSRRPTCTRRASTSASSTRSSASGFLDTHVPTIRARYRRQRDAMQAALRRASADDGPLACRWQHAGRRHVLLGRAAGGRRQRRAARQGGRARRRLRSGRAVLRRRAALEHAAAVVRHRRAPRRSSAASPRSPPPCATCRRSGVRAVAAAARGTAVAP